MDKLQRYRIRRDGVIEAVDTGGWLQWPDVDALLASIREAVEAERTAWCEFWYKPGDGKRGPKRLAWETARAALDALLSLEDDEQ